jgi:hypothetical protein
MPFIRRRDILRGLGLGAGTAFFAPFVGELLREAHGQARPAGRFVLLRGHWSYENKWGRPEMRSPSDFSLPETMSPLEKHRASLWMVYNMSAPGVGANGGHGIHVPDFLSCMRTPTYNRTGISFDRLLAQRIGGNDRFPSVSLSTGGGTDSFDSPTKGYPAIKDPLEAYDKLFAQALTGTGVDTKALLAQDKSTLDFVMGDVVRLNARLAGPERGKLDRYLESLRQVEKKLSLVLPGTCKPPTRPAAPGATEIARSELLAEIGTVAVACGVTRVLSMTTPEYDWRALGAPQADGHGVVHSGHPSMANVHKWRMGVFSRIFAHLGELGVADSSLVVYTDPNGTVHHGGTGNNFFVLGLGTLNGYFKAPNFIQYSRSGEKASTATPPRGVGEVFVSIANALGVAIDVFGLPSHCQGPMPGLHA